MTAWVVETVWSVGENGVNRNELISARDWTGGVWVGTRLPQRQFLTASTQTLTVNNVGREDDTVGVTATNERENNNPTWFHI